MTEITEILSRKTETIDIITDTTEVTEKKMTRTTKNND